MAASKNQKSILISQLIDELKVAFPNAEELPRRPIVESVILAILRENRSLKDSNRALEHFLSKSNYVDLNELRVSELREIQNIIGNTPDSDLRARAIRKFLKQIFQKNYKYDIDGIAKKTFKEAKDELKDYEALTSDFIMAQAQVQTLGGHAFPVDNRILLMAKRLGLVDENADHSTLRGIFEKNITKAQIHLAIALVEEFVNEVCTIAEPKCLSCQFNAICPGYEAMKNPPKTKPKVVVKKAGSKGAKVALDKALEADGSLVSVKDVSKSAKAKSSKPSIKAADLTSEAVTASAQPQSDSPIENLQSTKASGKPKKTKPAKASSIATPVDFEKPAATADPQSVEALTGTSEPSLATPTQALKASAKSASAKAKPAKAKPAKAKAKSVETLSTTTSDAMNAPEDQVDGLKPAPKSAAKKAKSSTKKSSKAASKKPK